MRVKKVLTSMVLTVVMVASFVACGSGMTNENVAGTYTGTKILESGGEEISETVTLNADGTYECKEVAPFGEFEFTGTYEISGEKIILSEADGDMAAYCPEATVSVDTDAKTITFE